MSYLVVDGIAIRVAAATPSLGYDNIGTPSRSINGSYLPSLRAQKRKWTCKTPPLSDADARALEAWLARVVRPDLTTSPYATTSGYLPVSTAGINQDAAGAPTGEAAQHLNYSPTSGEIVLTSATSNPFFGYTDAWSFSVWLKGGVTASHTSKILGLAGSCLTVTPSGIVTWTAPSLSGVDLSDNAWHHVAIAVYLDSANLGHYSLFCDGALAASGTASTGTTSWQSLQAATVVQLFSWDVTHTTNTNTYPGLVYQPLFVGDAVTAAQALALYNARAGVVLGAWPRRRVTGAMVGGRVLTCDAELTGADPVDFYASGAMQKGRAVSFNLIES
jgi:hypothetical protein